MPADPLESPPEPLDPEEPSQVPADPFPPFKPYPDEIVLPLPPDKELVPA